MRKAILSIFLFTILFCTSFAGGFQVNLQGQKQSGMGHTGTGFLTDAATILFNPGGMIFLDSVKTVCFGGSFIIHKTKYLEPFPGIYTADMEESIGTPFSLYTAFKTKNTNKWNLGLGIYTPFGSKAVWPDNWKGQFIIREISLQTIFFQPTISYKVNDKLGIGFGPVAALGNFGLRKAIPLQDTMGFYGEAKLDGKGNGFGFNAGVYFKATEKLSVGLDLRSPVKINVTGGDAKFTVPSSLQDSFPDNSFHSALTLPFDASFGIGYKLNSDFSFAADVNYIGWRSYDSLKIDFDQTNSFVKNTHSPKKFENSFIFRIGMQYHPVKNITVRLGAYYDLSPVQPGYVSPDLPDADKIGITSGLTFTVGDHIRVDLSFLYIDAKERTDTSLETGFGGTYKTNAIVPGIGLELLF